MLRQPLWHVIWAVIERGALCFLQLRTINAQEEPETPNVGSDHYST